MVKQLKIMKYATLEAQAAQVVLSLLGEVPFLMVGAMVEQPAGMGSGYEPDFEIPVRWPGGEMVIIGARKSSGQPAVARQAIAELELYVQKRPGSPGSPGSMGVLVAPYLSPAVMAMCADRRIGAVDLSGNARLMFGNVFIDRQGNPNRFSEERELRSIFTPKAARVLRVLLENPREAWPVKKLAEEAKVSLGQVSKVKQALERMEWLAQERGICLKDPEVVLKRWAAQQGVVEAKRVECYTTLTDDQLEPQLEAMARNEGMELAYSGMSAAWRLAPMVQPPRRMVYVDGDPERLASLTQLKRVDHGGNVILIQPRDEGAFYKATKTGKIAVVGAVQAYLDCMRVSGRGEEAAEAILEQRLGSTW